MAFAIATLASPDDDEVDRVADLDMMSERFCGARGLRM